MRKIYSFLLLTLFLSVGLNAWADDVITFADLGLTNGVQYTDPFDGGTFTVTFGGGGNDGKYYTTGAGIRVYGGGTMTIAAKTGNLASITITYDGSYKPTSDDVVNVGTYKSSTGVWTGEASSVVFTRPSGSGHWRVKSVTATISSGGSTPTCVTPTFNPAAGTYSSAQSVELTSTTEDAIIYYTMDGSEPSNTSTQYTGAITVNETMTIKAIATKANYNNSSIASATYTITTPSLISAVRAQGTGSVFTQGVVTSCVGTTGYIQDATAAICVYGANLTVGDEITVSGTLSTYNGLLEITSPKVIVLSSGNEVTPTVKTIAEINADYAADNALQGWLVKIENATVTSVSDQNTTIQQGENSIVVRGITANPAPAKNDVVTLTGNIGCFNAAQIANPTDIIISAVCATPTFSPAAGTYTSVQSVEISCTTEGATIYYTTNGDEPSNASTQYTGAITVNETMTIKAIAIKNGLTDSEIASAAYTITLTPVINASNVNLTYDATSGEIAYTIDNPTGATLVATLTEGNWVSNVTVDAVNSKVTFTTTANEGDEDRNATITLSYTGAESKVITVTQAHFVVDYATLPFAFNGGKADIETTNGLTQDGLGSDYSSAPKLKFDGTSDYLILKINEMPGTLTFDIKGNSFSGSTFKVQTSENGVDYTDLESYTSLGNTQNEEFVLTSEVRYIKWIYTEKVSGNVALGNIALSQYVAPSTDPTITLTPNEVNASAAETDGTIGIAYEYLTIDVVSDFGIQYYNDALGNEESQDEPDWIATEIVKVNEDYQVSYLIEANDGASRTAYFKVYALDDETNPVYSNLVTINQAAYVAPVPATTYTLVTDVNDIVLGAHYIIASNNDGDLKVMGAQNSNNRAAVDATAANSSITIASDEIREFIICKDGNNTYAIYDEEDGGGYLYAASSSSNHLKSQAKNDNNGRWSISIDNNNGEATIIAQGKNSHNKMRYNSGNGLFSCYLSDQQPIYLYKKDGESFTSELIEISEVGYATLYYRQKNLIVPEGVTAYIFDTTTYKLNESEAFTAGEVIPKDQGVVLAGAENIYEFVVTAVQGTKLANNGLLGSDDASDIYPNNEYYYYGLSLNSSGDANSVGFYWMEENGAAFHNGAHKAYLKIAKSHFQESAPARFFVFNSENNATSIEELGASDETVKFMQNGKLFIIREGVVYDAMGKMVK